MSFKKKLITGITLASSSAFIIHAFNKIVYFSATLDNLLSNPSGTYYNWKFGNIYYKKTGKGHPLLLIHDLNPYSSGHEWNKVLKELSKTNTIYRIDLLGCGRSDKPNITYTNYLYVQLINDFIKHIIGEQTDIIATGNSAAVAIAACHNNSSSIRKLILVNPSDTKEYAKIPTKRTKTLVWLINLPIIGTFLYNITTNKNNIESLFREYYYYDCNKIDYDTISTYYETAHMGKESAKRLFASLSGNYTTVNLIHCLKTIKNSVYLIMGENKENSKEIVEKYTHILPSIETVFIKETRHLPQLEKDKEFVEQVNLFLGEEF